MGGARGVAGRGGGTMLSHSDGDGAVGLLPELQLWGEVVLRWGDNGGHSDGLLGT